MKPKIFIGVPNLGSVGTLLSVRLREWYSSGKYQITIVEVTGVRPLEVALNRILDQFLKSDCEYLFTINDDEHLPSDALDRLLAHDKDIVIPLGFKWDRDLGPMPCVGVRVGGRPIAEEMADHFEEPQTITVTEVPRWIQPVSGYAGLRKCDRIGNSGVLIKRHVIEALPLGAFRLDMPEDRLSVTASEDFVWSDAMRAAGFEIWVDCTMKLDHFKQVNLYKVKELMVADRMAGQGDAVRAIEKMLAAGATAEQAIDGIREWYAENRAEVFVQKVEA